MTTIADIELQLGNVAEWVGSLGTVAALLAAVALLRHEHRLRRDAADQELRAQARQVSVWVEEAPDDQFTGDITHLVCVHNASDQTIYTVAVYLDDTGDSPVGEWQTIALGRTKTAPWPNRDIPPRLSFFDASGNLWQRHRLGRLELVQAASNYRNTKWS